VRGYQPDQDIVQEGSWDANSVHPSRSGTAIDLAWNDGLSDHQQNYVDHHGYTTYDSRIKLKRPMLNSEAMPPAIIIALGSPTATR